MENVTRYNPEENYNPNDIITNAPDFEEPIGGAYPPNNSHNQNLAHQISKEVQKDKEEVKSPYNKSYTLKKPINFEGEWVKEIYLDFDSLTGRDIMDASKGVDSFVQETDKRYLSAVAARAMGKPKEIMFYMSAKDVTAICYYVSDFLID